MEASSASLNTSQGNRCGFKPVADEEVDGGWKNTGTGAPSGRTGVRRKPEAGTMKGKPEGGSCGVDVAGEEEVARGEIGRELGAAIGLDGPGEGRRGRSGEVDGGGLLRTARWTGDVVGSRGGGDNRRDQERGKRRKEGFGVGENGIAVGDSVRSVEREAG